MMMPSGENKYLVYGLIAVGAALRVLAHVTAFSFVPPNFAPVTGMALLAGAYIPGKQAWWVPLGALLLSDIFIGFHSPLVMGSVYGSYLLIVFFGRWLSGHVTVLRVGGAALASSVLFYLVTNAAVWAAGLLYPLTLAGLLQSYVMGIPFFRYTLAGDLFFTVTFFVCFALARQWQAQVATRRVSVVQ